MGTNKRQEQIIEKLNENSEITVKELAKGFSVSEMTIRRDFKILEDANLITRTHGGGVNNNQLSFDLFLGEKLKVNLSQKRAISKKAAEHISHGEPILIDTGTTVFHIAQYLEDRQDLTVATPSLAVASTLYWNKSANLMLLGGYIKSWYRPDLVGPLTENNINGLNFKTAFLGADGVDPEEGFFCNDMDSANVVKNVIKNSERVIVLADSSKIGTKSLVKYADFKDVDLLITDSGAPDKIEKLIKLLTVETVEV